MKQAFKFCNKVKPKTVIDASGMFLMLLFGILYLITSDWVFVWLMSMCALAMFIGTNKKERKPPAPPDKWWEDVHTMD